MDSKERVAAHQDRSESIPLPVRLFTTVDNFQTKYQKFKIYVLDLFLKVFWGSIIF